MHPTTHIALACSILLPFAGSLRAKEIHVSKSGNNMNVGSRQWPVLTIQRAAELAQPGDVVTVHAGIYRERVNPPRGGLSEKQRIVYRAARGEKVEIRGSEPIKSWTHVKGDVWKVTIPNTFFGKFNPYNELIRGDWFEDRGRPHHVGAVYLNGYWLVEAAKLEEVMDSSGAVPAWLSHPVDQYLLNVGWLRAGPEGGPRVPANKFAKQQGVQTAPSSEGGECIGWIEPGDWVRYDGVNFGEKTEQVEIRTASQSEGGVIELRLDSPAGELIGSCTAPGTGDWQSWTTVKAAIKPTSGEKNLCLVFRAKTAARPNVELADTLLWSAKVDEAKTVIWAQFKGVNPNEQEVEINVRETVFYPDRPFVNYITVRGFTMRHAATPWAPPTAEQKGLIGTHWSKGWIIEDNVISHSVCSGVALGKHGDQYDNTSANTAEGYVKTIERGLAMKWNRDSIGHHIVRNNTISHCEQTGIVGSLGSAFCTVTGNTIHDIHVRRLFTGAEMAGIKFHGAIDTVIEQNHIYRTCLGLWLDWMAQGTRVSRNLFQENGRDLFVEVNHGPFLVDNNLFLSAANLLDVSEGGAYVHNLFAGNFVSAPEPNRETPYHPAHVTTMAGLVTTKGGDNRFYNNIFAGRPGASEKERISLGLAVYDSREYPTFTGGNVYYNGAQPYARETDAVRVNGSLGLRLLQEDEKLMLSVSPGPEIRNTKTKLVTTELLGKAKVPGVAYENADGSPFTVNRDFFGKKRSKKNPTPGPFEKVEEGLQELQLKP